MRLQGGHHIKIKSRRGVTCYLNVPEGREGVCKKLDLSNIFFPHPSVPK